ncbi:MAG: HIT family protein [archaeon]
MDITEEQLKDLTPEQLKELQKQNCIFCHISAGRVASKKIFEDEKCLAILDINPANPGHVVLFPKEHYAILPQVPEDLISHLFKVAKGICNAALRTMECQGTNIFLANGVAAGQKAPHVMIHIIPRMEGDNLKAFDLEGKVGFEQRQQEIAKALAKRLNPGAAQETVSMDEKTEQTAKPDEKPVDDEQEPEDKEESQEQDTAEEIEDEDSDKGEDEGSEEDDDTDDDQPEEEDDKEGDEEDESKKSGGLDLDDIAKVLGR